MKEQILKDIGDTVCVKDVYDNTKCMSGTISMITVTKKGIKYRGLFDNSIVPRQQHDFWQDEIIE